MREPKETSLADTSLMDIGPRGDIFSDKINRPQAHNAFASWDDNRSSTSSYARLSQFFGFSSRNKLGLQSDKELPIYTPGGSGGVARSPLKSRGMTVLDVSGKNGVRKQIHGEKSKSTRVKCCVLQISLVVLFVALLGLLITNSIAAAGGGCLGLDEGETDPYSDNDFDFCGEEGADDDIRFLIADEAEFLPSGNGFILQMNNIEVECIPPDAFVFVDDSATPLSFVEEINLEGLALTNISAEAFGDIDLPSLRVLRIVDNGLSTLPEGFIGLLKETAPLLDILDFSGNAFQDLDNDIFESARDFEIIDFSRNSGLVEVPTALAGLSSVDKLLFNDCPSLVRAELALLSNVDILTVEVLGSPLPRTASKIVGNNILELALRELLGLEEEETQIEF